MSVVARRVTFSSRTAEILDSLRESEIQFGTRVLGVWDEWHNVGDLGEPSFEDNWSQFGPGDAGYASGLWEQPAPVSFLKDTSGFVRMRGVAKHPDTMPAHGSTRSYYTIFTLPPGYRPARTILFTPFGDTIQVHSGQAQPIYLDGQYDVSVPGGTAVVEYWSRILPTGEVDIVKPGSPNTDSNVYWVVLDSIYFDADGS